MKEEKRVHPSMGHAHCTLPFRRNTAAQVFVSFKFRIFLGVITRRKQNWAVPNMALHKFRDVGKQESMLSCEILTLIGLHAIWNFSTDHTLVKEWGNPEWQYLVPSAYYASSLVKEIPESDFWETLTCNITRFPRKKPPKWRVLQDLPSFLSLNH